ncbi:hypothetical protein K469DRAFT_232918 [Zopfia rhizophila CBS 207.26]|uniref:Zn(2)-C6 fungal-type domain-containing protein n=1 Tax=Zopfia rhizophila CBS 207.26 TaxID=1314779 RepID=A0A6A6DVZ6_9PEZI|nr:hypothetical protein K469DRAFT_232918 [Zopfia rhizophila CBS 207.26]
MPTPCLNCSRRGNDCLVNLSSSRCSACAGRNVKCDLIVSQPKINALSSVLENCDFVVNLRKWIPKRKRCLVKRWPQFVRFKLLKRQKLVLGIKKLTHRNL